MLEIVHCILNILAYATRGCLFNPDFQYSALFAIAVLLWPLKSKPTIVKHVVKFPGSILSAMSWCFVQLKPRIFLKTNVRRNR